MLLADTGPLVAVANDRDEHHERCQTLLETHRGPVAVPAPVIVEVYQLIASWVGAVAATVIAVAERRRDRHPRPSPLNRRPPGSRRRVHAAARPSPAACTCLAAQRPERAACPVSSPSAGRLAVVTGTHPQRLERASGLSRRLLAVLVGLLATFGLIVSGAAPVSAQNAVGPQPVNSILAVGPHQAAGQENVGVRGPPLRQTASATGAAADTADGAAGDAADDPADATCGGNSFTPDTTVVMADGSTKPLDQVKVGDKVEATDTATGKTSAQTVTTVWVNHDSDLMNVTIEAGGKTSVIQATQHHLFWDVTRKAWVEADQLVAGDQLQADTGTVATVAGAVVVPGGADMWDLTVNNDHDFYVVTSSANVLVHNCPDRGPKQGSGQSQLPSWYSNGGYGPEAGETPTQATTRIFNDRYGEGNYPRGPNTEFNKVQKYISRRSAGGG